MRKLTPLIICTFLAVAGCDKPDRSVRHYKEVSFAVDHAHSDATLSESTDAAAQPSSSSSSARAMGELPPEMRTPSLPLQWTTPEGWDETPGSGMRIVTFMVKNQECTILTFPGDVGGDEANIRRWLGQLGASASDAEIKSFVDKPVRFVTEGGFECRFFDFENLIPSGSPKNALAGIIPVGEHTAFVKLMGDSAILKEQKDLFEALCKSIRLKADSI